MALGFATAAIDVMRVERCGHVTAYWTTAYWIMAAGLAALAVMGQWWRA
jgi:hypothetical protein